MRIVRFIVLVILVICPLALVFATDTTNGATASLAWGTMMMELFGGLALFLLGMEEMSDALKNVAGDRMRKVLAQLTANRFMGAITGALVTAVIQSSSVTTVLVVGFISAGLMNMTQSIGVIMGANIGTTITAQIIAFKVTKAALAMIAIGFAMQFSRKYERLQQYGTMLMGLGMIFFGMNVMSSAMVPLRTYQPFLDLMVTMENPWIGILVAAIFTGLVQSSSATTGIVIVMASQGFISLPAGIALAFGANIGTCVTALLASIGKPREALRAATIHIVFNLAGVVLWIGFIDQLASLVTLVSPAHDELSGMARLAAEAPRQIANAHTIFNVANTIVFIGLAGSLGRLVVRLVPDRIEEEVLIKAKFLDDELMATPSIALASTRMEMGRMGERTGDMLRRILPAILHHRRDELKEITAVDDEVDVLHQLVVTYLSKISQLTLTRSQTRDFFQLMEAANDIENIGDIIETDLAALGQKCIGANLRISEESGTVLTALQEEVSRILNAALNALRYNEPEPAQEVISAKTRINGLAEDAAHHLANRLLADEPNRMALYALEIDIIEKLKRIYYYAKRISKTVVGDA